VGAQHVEEGARATRPEATAAVVTRVMEGVAQLSVPLVVETGTGRSWGDAH
jgi:DNA polymerase-1